MLHNSLPMVKKVHMQNISHVPIRIDWVVYDIDQDVVEQPKLIELIPVVDNNPFDEFENRLAINEVNDEFMSQTTASTSKETRSTDSYVELFFICFLFLRLETSFPSDSSVSPRSSGTSNEQKPSPMIKLFVKPYRGTRPKPGHAVYTTTSIHKVKFNKF